MCLVEKYDTNAVFVSMTWLRHNQLKISSQEKSEIFCGVIIPSLLMNVIIKKGKNKISL